MQRRTLTNMLRSNAYITVNKTLIKNIGLLPATMLSELCGLDEKFYNEGKLKDGYFYSTIENFKENTGLSRDEQETALKKLLGLKVVDKKVAKLKGDEAPKRYLKVTDNVDVILSLLKEPERKKNTPQSPENTGFVEMPQIDLHETANKKNTPQSPENTGFVEMPQIDMRESHKSSCGNGTNQTGLQVSCDNGLNTSYKNKDIIINHKNNQSVSPARTGENVKTSCQTTDRLTEKKVSQRKLEEKPHLPVCEVTEADIKQQIGYSALATLGDTSLLDEVVLNMFDMYHSSGVKIKDEIKSQAIVHSVLSKVTYWHVVYLLDRFKQVTTPIKNKKGYLQTMIYNSVLEQQAHYTNEVQVDQLAWAEELSPQQEQGHKQDQGNAIPQRDNFEQRQYSDEYLGNFYCKLDVEEVEGARA